MMDLRAYLASYGLTQGALATILRVSPRTVRGWARKGAPLTVRALLEAGRRIEPGNPTSALRAVLGAVASNSERAET